MTSISSVNAASAAAMLHTGSKPVVAHANSQSVSNPTVGSTSAAKVPSSIAAIALRSAQSEGGSEPMLGGHEVPDGDADD